MANHIQRSGEGVWRGASR